MRMPFLIAEGQVHRLILSTFLHYGLCHLLMTMILQVAIGTLAESVMGACRFMVFFVLVCIGSNLFGAACTYNYALGADSVVFAYLGSLLTIMMVYWSKLGSPDAIMQKICAIIMIIVILIISFLLIVAQAAISSKYTKAIHIDNPDIFGMLGGILYGFTCAMFLLPVQFKRDGQW